MAAHIAALNAGNEADLAATLHFPHYRLSGGVLQTWDGPDQSWLISMPVPAMAGTIAHGIRWM